MGYDPEPPVEGELPEHVPSSIAALTPAPRGGVPVDGDEPEIVAQRQPRRQEHHQALHRRRRCRRAGRQDCPKPPKRPPSAVPCATCASGNSQISKNSSSASRITSASGSPPGPDLEADDGLIHEHSQAVDRAAAAIGGGADQPGLRRIEDHVGHDQLGPQRLDGHRQRAPSSSPRPIDVALMKMAALGGNRILAIQRNKLRLARSFVRDNRSTSACPRSALD